MTPHFIDALLALIVLISIWSGWSRGFMVATLDLLALLSSFLVAFFAYAPVAAWVRPWLPQPGVWTEPTCFVLLLFGVHILLSVLAGKLARQVPRPAHAHGVNRFLGLAPGLVNGALHAAVAAVVLMTFPWGPANLWVRDSVLAQQVAGPAEWLETQVAPIFDPALRSAVQTLSVQPASRTSIPLKSKVASSEVRVELEAKMLELVNAERATRQLPPLKADPDLAEVARAHSRDMFARGYFSHVSPDGRDLQDRMRSAKVGFLAAGENLALAPTLARAHQGLMNSPGHRANILRPQFGRLGIGVLDGGVHGLMVTQNFRN